MAIKTTSTCLVLTLINKYEPFSDLSIRALKLVSKIHGIELNSDQINKFREAQLNLDPFPDSKKELELLLKSRDVDDINNRKLVILSNGERSKTEQLLSNLHLVKYFDHIFSAEEVRKYKPAKEPYLLASERLGIPISEIALVSSNLWDIAGTQAAGMQTGWINRKDKKTDEEDINMKADYILSSLEDLKQIFIDD
jgi:2-haloacid dehalogenase